MFKKSSLIFCLVGVSLLIYACENDADNYESKWDKLSDASKNSYCGGMISGISWATPLHNDYESMNKLMFDVLTNVETLDHRAIAKNISELYKDPANAQLHYELLFFPAAAKLLGYSEKDVAILLRIFRSVKIYKTKFDLETQLDLKQPQVVLCSHGSV